MKASETIMKRAEAIIASLDQQQKLALFQKANIKVQLLESVLPTAIIEYIEYLEARLDAIECNVDAKAMQ